MDTDSLYMALSHDLEDSVKPALKEEYLTNRHLWFPRASPAEAAAFDRRTPGLFHVSEQATFSV